MLKNYKLLCQQRNIRKRILKKYAYFRCFRVSLNFLFLSIFSSVLILPQITFATVGDEINSLIDSFFGEGQSPEEEYSWEDPMSETPDIDIAEILLPESQQGLQKEIMFEEDSLEEFERNMGKAKVHLDELLAKESGQETQIFLLDQQIGFNKQKIHKYQKSEDRWKKILEQLARERTILKAEIRWQEEAYVRYMRKKFVRNENFNYDKDYSLALWLFSPKTISEILREKKNEDFVTLKKQGAKKRLDLLRKAFEKREKRIAQSYTNIAQLKKRLVHEKMILESAAERKARYLEGLNQEKVTTISNFKEAEKGQIESTIYLQELRNALKEKKYDELDSETQDQSLEGKTDLDSKKNSEAATSLMSWPLKTEIKIEAVFHDEKYEKEFGQVHEGLDIFAPQDTTVYAPLGGIVEKVSINGYGYSYIILKHEDDLYTTYGHISKSLVQKGDRIKKGDKIALTGGTPGTIGAGYFTTGPHLHFEVFENGKHRNPLRFLPDL